MEQEERNEKFSNELKQLLSFIEKTTVKEFPTPIVTAEYFVFAVLDQKDSLAYTRLYDNMTNVSLDAIHDSFYKQLQLRALSAMRPGREIKYDSNLLAYFDRAEEIRKELGTEKITSEYVLIAIFEDDKCRVGNVFKVVGLSASILYDKVKEAINSSSRNTESPKKRVEDTNRLKKKQDGDSVISDGKFGGLDLSSLPDGTVINISSTDGNPSELIKSMFGNIGGPSSPIIPGSRMKNRDQKEPNIKLYCSNLNDLVESGEIDPLVGRDREVQEIIRILGRRRKNNVILIGGEGVGKTAIGENIAYKIVNGDVPPFLMNKKVISLDMTSLIAGTTLRGMFEERVKGVLDEIKADGNYILFIDNIGAVLADKGKGDFDISSMLSHALENGEVQVIGTADFKSFRTTFEKDPSLSRRFQKVIVEAPSIEESKEVLFGLRPYYEEYHNVKFTDDAIVSCVELANRYIAERNLPDSAIDVLDEAGSFISTSYNDTPEIREKKKRIRDLKREAKKLRREDNMEESDAKMEESKKLNVELNETLDKINKERKEHTPEITKDTILHIISMKTGIPVDNLSADDKKKLAHIDERLKKDVIGQDEAIDTITKALKRNRIGLHTGKCMYSMIAIGKSGVGKTLIAKKLAKEMFGDEKALVRFDMSEYPDKTAVNKLIGSNPGYVGYEEGGQLTETIKNKKHCVLLLDEIEKADPEIYNIFLQVLDEGFLTDNSGMKVDFRNVIVIFTSNVGTKAASDFGKGIGFNENADENSKRILLKQLKNKFPPEFLNRLDSIIYFNNLNDNDLRKIIKLEITELEKKVKDIGYGITYDEDTIDFILDIVKDQREFGARPIKRAIQDEIEDKITDLLLEREYESGYVFRIKTDEDKKKISVA